LRRRKPEWPVARKQTEVPRLPAAGAFGLASGLRRAFSRPRSTTPRCCGPGTGAPPLPKGSCATKRTSVGTSPGHGDGWWMSDKHPQPRNPPQQQVRARAVSGDQALQVEAFSGLLPHPEILKEYEAILPGAAEHLLQLAEREQANRNGLEKEVKVKPLRDCGASPRWGHPPCPSRVARSTPAA